jgi:hypothetical protein
VDSLKGGAWVPAEAPGSREAERAELETFAAGTLHEWFTGYTPNLTDGRQRKVADRSGGDRVSDEESRAFADPVTRSLIAPVRVQPTFGRVLADIRNWRPVSDTARARDERDAADDES